MRSSAGPRLPLGFRRTRWAASVLAGIWLGSLPAGRAQAWIYPEHRDITVLALDGLDAERRATIDALWAESRAGHEDRLCAAVVDTTQGTKPSCFDWAAWPAIAGDHSCSGAELVSTIIDAAWSLDVAAIGAELKRDLAGAESRAKRINDLRRSDLKLQRSDLRYATRAGSNNVHFLLARPNASIDHTEYLRLCLVEGSEPSAIGAYAWYHTSALMKASRLHGAADNRAERVALARAVLADEAFAIHFLEDAFSAGHVAGTWGSAAVRKGTHDYYNERGLDTPTWNRGEHVLAGDAHMRPEDAERAAKIVRTSIEQIADASRGRVNVPSDAAAEGSSPDAVDVCSMKGIPSRPASPAARPLELAIADELPVPALGDGLGAVPRFRAELGAFIGISAAAGASFITGGFSAGETTGGAIGVLDVGLRLGLGLEGVMGESGDGLVFLDLGLRHDTASSMSFSDNPALVETGAITAAIPARSALTLRVRAPFWLVPGDLVLAALVVAPLSRRLFMEMAAVASNGGLVPWQVGIATGIGRFQFVVGREVAISFYGFVGGGDRMLMPPGAGGATARLVALRSIAFDFPLVEYRPFRAFSLDQASMLVFQIVGGFQTSAAASVISPMGAARPDLHNVYSIGIRLTFDWRHY